MLLNAQRPTAVLLLAVLKYKAEWPIATLSIPPILHLKELTPTAVFVVPVVLRRNELKPTATLPTPVVLEHNALLPTLVLVETFPPPNPILTELNAESKVELIAPTVSIATVGIIQFTPNLQLVTSEYKKDTLCIVVVPVVLTK